MSVFPACVYVCYMYAWCLWRPGEGEGVLYSRTGVIDGYSNLMLVLGTEPSSSQKHTILLTMEPYFKPSIYIS